MLLAAKEEMFSGVGPWCAHLPLPADPQLAENSRQGFQVLDSTLHLGLREVKSSTTLGMRRALYDTAIRSRCTGKERDSESGLDYFGARYYSNGLGRFVTPDWSAVPVPVPYADLEDPQSLNQYTYVRNLPTTKTDPTGHFDVNFKSPELEKMFDKIGTESTDFRTEISAAKADHNVIVTVQEVGVQQLGDHAPGDAKVSRDADGKVHVTINVKPDDEKTTEHEVGHEKDARTNTNQFFKDATKDAHDKGGPNQKPHDDRPVEQRANNFRDTVEKQRKEYREQQKKEQKEQQRQKKEHKEPQ